MSKSLGNGIDPMELIDQHGADALRFGLMNQMSFDNQAIKFDEGDVTAGRNFANKVWNLARLLDSLPERDEESVSDKWIKSRYQEVESQVTNLIEQYKLGEAIHFLYDFVWHDFADEYVENIKIEGSTVVAREIFNHTIKLLHPFMPYVTEVIWQHQNSSSQLMTSTWPSNDYNPDPKATQQVLRSKEITYKIRQARRLLPIPMSENINLYTASPTDITEALAKKLNAQLMETIPSDNENTLRLPIENSDPIYIHSKFITADRVKIVGEKLTADIDREKDSIKYLKKQKKGMKEAGVPEEKIEAWLNKIKIKEQNVEQMQKVLDTYS